MVRNVIANEKKTSLHGVYFHVELITFPLVSTCKVSVFDLKNLVKRIYVVPTTFLNKIPQMTISKLASKRTSNWSLRPISSKSF